MLALIYKDFLYFKSQRRFIGLILMITFLILFTGEVNFALVFSGFISAAIAISTINNDDFYHVLAYLFTTPVTKKKYVLEKYILTLISTLVTILILGLLSCFYLILTSKTLDNLVNSILISLIVPLLIIIITIPLTILFGNEKGRYAMMAISGIILLISQGFNKLNINLFNLDVHFLYLLGLVFLVVLLFLSIICSLKIMDRKEF